MGKEKQLLKILATSYLKNNPVSVRFHSSPRQSRKFGTTDILQKNLLAVDLTHNLCDKFIAILITVTKLWDNYA